MSAPTRTHQRSGSEFIETARVDVIVPHDSNINIEEAITSIDTTKETPSPGLSFINRLPQRKFLFYDETVIAYVVLEQPGHLEESRYNAYLARLAVSLEVTAVDGSKRPEHIRASDGVHLLYQTTIDEKVTERIELTIGQRRIILWKVEIPLGHPKARLSDPQIVLAASAVLRQAEERSTAHEEEYITKRQPIGINLLEPFAEDPALGAVKPRLSASRVARIMAHTKPGKGPNSHLGYSPKRFFHVYPAINIRLRYSRLVSGNRQDVIASLDMEVTAYGNCRVKVEDVNITVQDGHSRLLEDATISLFPIECHPHDDITLLYALEMTDLMKQASSMGPTVRPISVSLRAVALISDGCQPVINTNWSTTIDFATPGTGPISAGPHGGRQMRSGSFGQQYGAVAAETLSSAPGIQPHFKRSHRHNPSIQFTLPPEQALQKVDKRRSETSASGKGLTITFSGPTRVHVGQVFSWSVFVFNQSTKPRKFALVVHPKRRRGGEGKLLPPTPQDKTEPVLDDGSMYLLHKSQHLDPVDLIPLDNDIRIG
ncbi:hypothetical protein BJ508DRAFT_318146 [Ascobolus immersus RN42]|uniref:Trafficking protein particle complex II-specific subunit 65 IgD3 domain-containing protein n=1 Tax=Ascobolus immersus RN42 TaxID=1160509 RepID=A0A3N4IKT1_ASCIM|nr:hypothetical protein BJ508DRAFT_318146 [Ascobolus immersus RN42]